MKFQCCFYILPVAVCLLLGCSPSKFIGKAAQAKVIKNKNLQTAHIGISIYDAEASRYVYDYGGDKYFVPASNVKLATCYAAMKYLGDSLVGLRYDKPNDSSVNILGTGDPTFLHPDFKIQPAFDLLKKNTNISYQVDGNFIAFSPLGKGWAWDDYGDDYAAERSEMPIYGNVANFYIQGDTVAVDPPAFYSDNFRWLNETLRKGVGLWFNIVRPFENNSFHALSSASMYRSKTKFSSQFVPFKTISYNGKFQVKASTFMNLLEDTLHKKLEASSSVDAPWHPVNVLRTQPTDSVLKPMMHRSDNFFAEQTLLMVSNERLGLMNDGKIIDTLLKTDLAGLPQPPHWVDGSGLSRYNLFTPQDLVTILNKMRAEFGIERLKNILATGGQGTLANYYKADSSFLWAKTGTLSGVVALSGFMYTRRGKLLLFSVQVNNHTTSGTAVRRAVESFIEEVRRRL